MIEQAVSPPDPSDPWHLPGPTEPQLPNAPGQDPNQVPSGVPTPEQGPELPSLVPGPGDAPEIQPMPM